MKKRPRIKLKGAAEDDALTSARKFYCYLTKPGVVKKIKRQYNKRFRKKGKVNGSIEKE
ncbi:MAG: hypothetical protein HKN86_04050 [Acidimicrobiia bacterium]|nr:hypothetical protein [Acidimicrobiia bacterium]